jgi:predicted Fe-S protein YdhL (DUF1289 family)
LETPSVNICLPDAKTGFCAGCGPSLDEIAGWASMSDSERRAIMAKLPLRKTRLKAAKG